MQKVLIATYYWPPAGGPGVQRWLYFVKYLRGFGVEPVLYIPEKPHYPITDPELQQLVPKGLCIYRSRFWEPYRLAGLFARRKTRRISSGIIRKQDRSWTEKLLLWIRGNLFIPDARRNWVAVARRELPAILENEGIRTVITTGPPHSVHLIGLEAKKRHGVRWVADFRDPWTEIGYQSSLYLGGRAQRRHRELEEQVLREADCVVATSRKTAADLGKIAGRPVQVITNGYEMQPAEGAQPEGPFVLAHVGSLLSGRNPFALWSALGQLCKEDAQFAESLSLELTGLVSPEVESALKRFGIWDRVRIEPYIPHAEAVQRQRQAQVLLLIEIDAPETRGILPGKLFEYMAASRPVLAIGPEEWEASALVREAGCGSGFTYDQRDAIIEQLRIWFREYQSGTLNGKAAGIEKYHRKALTEQFAKEILWESSAGNPS